MNLTPNKLNWFMEAHRHIIDIAEQYFDLKDLNYNDIMIDSMCSNVMSFRINYSVYRCGTWEIETTHYTVPNTLFADIDGWLAAAKIEVALEKTEAKRKADAIRAQKEAAEAKNKERAERILLRQLKEKYGDE